MDVGPDQEGKTFKTGQGGALLARKTGVAAFVTACFSVGLAAGTTNLTGPTPFANLPAWGFWLAGAVFLIAIVLGGFAMMWGLRERNSEVRVSAQGLAVRDWLGGETVVRWDDIRAVVWDHQQPRFVDEGYVLLIHAEDEDGFVMPKKIGYSHYAPSDDLVALRDEIISRRDLSPVHPTSPDQWARLASAVRPTETRVWK